MASAPNTAPLGGSLSADRTHLLLVDPDEKARRLLELRKTATV